MAAPIAGPVRSGSLSVQISLRPPIEFILRQAGEFRRALTDFTDLWERFKPIMGEFERQWFDSAGDGTWPPLADSTIAEKERLGYPLEPLVRTGELQRSLTDPNEALRVSETSAWYGTEVDYAHWHQVGGDIPGRPPVRQIIPDPFPIDARRRLEQAQVAWLNDVAARTFGKT